MISSGCIQTNAQTSTSQAGISYKMILNPTQKLIVYFKYRNIPIPRKNQK